MNKSGMFTPRTNTRISKSRVVEVMEESPHKLYLIFHVRAQKAAQVNELRATYTHTHDDVDVKCRTSSYSDETQSIIFT